MQIPSDIIHDILDRITEIIWWNRSLTRLNDINYFNNFEDFIYNNLISFRGPFLELNLPSEINALDTHSFLTKLNFEQVVIDTIIEVLFNNRNLHLYEHQARAIESIVVHNRDIILSVPTATGKTEAFFFPILDYCVKNDENGLKALIIYPMKTLEVDQLNRFIKYLYVLNNRIPDDRDSIKIGIWDGDTPIDVGDQRYNPGAIPAHSHHRGIVCPICSAKFRIDDSGFLYCEQHGSFTWIMVTRRNIANSKVDILISNPESIDFLIVSPENERKRILGDIFSAYPLKFLIFDEIHIWSGINGAAIKLFIERLTRFYEKNDPQLILLSATIRDPANLIASLTTSNYFEAIEFTPRHIPIIGNSDFSRLTPCSFEDLIKTFYYAAHVDNDINVLRNLIPNLDNTIHMIDLLGLATVNQNTNCLTISNNNLSGIVSVPDQNILTNSELFERFIADLLENYTFKEHWQNLIIQNLPEIAEIIQWIENMNFFQINFIHMDALTEFIENNGVPQNLAAQIGTMCLNFGRVAELLNDRYHIFIRPRDNLYWCSSCLELIEGEICNCGEDAKILRFCRRCHNIFTQDSIDGPFTSLIHGTRNVVNCPNCGRSNRNAHNVGVPYTMFLSFLISSACRKLDSKKIIIFSDGRGSAEKIGSNIILYDYSIVAEQLLLDLLIKHGGFKDTRNLYFDVLNKLDEYYYQILRDRSLDSFTSDRLTNFKNQFIKPLADITHMYLSIDNALITARCVNNIQNNEEMIIAHEFLKIYTSNFRNINYSNNNIYFQLRSQTIPTLKGITLDKVENRLRRLLPHLNQTSLTRNVANIFALFIENNVISEFDPNQITLMVNSQTNRANVTPERIQGFNNYLTAERNRLQNEFNNINYNYTCRTGLITRNPRQNNFEIELIDKVFICLNCYVSYPCHDNNVNNCPVCGSNDLNFGERLNKNTTPAGTIFTGLGFLDVDSTWRYNLDHWGSEILAKVIGNDDDNIKKVSIGVHRAGLTSTLRGIIEEGFRKNPPLINAVSSTPTLELGIDIGSLEAISLVGIPPLLSNYIQRSGRTGRLRGNYSFVFDIIRNQHSIDNYYYNNLEGYLEELRPIYIPNPEDFDILYAGHIMNIVCSYLARNPDQRNTYWNNFRIPSALQNIGFYYIEVMRRIGNLIILATQVKDQEIRDLLNNSFGAHAVEIYERLFHDRNDDLYLISIAERLFGRLRNIINIDNNAVLRLTEQYISLDWWLSLLGLNARFRGMSNASIPLYYPAMRSRDPQLYLQELDRAIIENYPGPQNGDGAAFRFEAAKFIVNDVRGSSEVLSAGDIKICTNRDCSYAFVPRFGNIDICDLCTTDLRELTIYGMNTIRVRPARPQGDHFETSPITITFPDLTNMMERSDGRFFNLDSTFEYGRIKVVDSTIAFFRRFRNSLDSEIFLSEALIEGVGVANVDLDNFDPYQLGADFAELGIQREQQTEVFNPVGLSYKTLGLKISFETQQLFNKIQNYQRSDLAGTNPNYMLMALVSIGQALKKITSIFTESEINDFNITFFIGDNQVIFYLIDKTDGGNGISKRVYDSITTNNQMYQIFENSILQCTSCRYFCHNCLLIERTPENYVRNNLLDRQLLERIYY